MAFSALMRVLEKAGKKSPLAQKIINWASKKNHTLKICLSLLRLGKLPLSVGAIALCLNDGDDIVHNAWHDGYFRLLVMFVFLVIPTMEALKALHDIVEAIQKHLEDLKDKKLGPPLLRIWILLLVVSVHLAIIWVLNLLGI